MLDRRQGTGFVPLVVALLAYPSLLTVVDTVRPLRGLSHTIVPILQEAGAVVTAPASWRPAAERSRAAANPGQHLRLLDTKCRETKRGDRC